MKKLLLSLSLFSAITANAQLTNFSVGQTAPNFTVTDIHGNSHTLYNYTSAGQYVIVDFFAYWCGPCAGIAPIVNDFYKKYGCNSYDVAVMSIEYEGTTAQTQTFEDSYGGDANFPTPSVSGLNGGGAAVHSTFGPAAFPTVVLIGPDNKFINIDIWPITSITNIEAAFPNGALTPQACLVSVSEEDLSMTLAVYPNPADDFVTIAFDNNKTQNVSYAVTNLLGEVVLQNSIGNAPELNHPIDINALNAGSYFVNIYLDGNLSAVSQLIVK